MLLTPNLPSTFLCNNYFIKFKKFHNKTNFLTNHIMNYILVNSCFSLISCCFCFLGYVSHEKKNKMKVSVAHGNVSARPLKPSLLLLYIQQLPRRPHSYCHLMQVKSIMVPKRRGPGTAPKVL